MILIISVESTRSEIIIARESQITLEKGTRGELPCEVQGVVDYVEWKRGSTAPSNEPLVLIIQHDGERIKQGSDFSRYDITSNFSLVVNDVEIISHEDRYFCTLRYSSTEEFFRNQINVTVFGEL